jgi:hypothetical protein
MVMSIRLLILFGIATVVGISMRSTSSVLVARNGEHWVVHVQTLAIGSVSVVSQLQHPLVALARQVAHRTLTLAEEVEVVLAKIKPPGARNDLVYISVRFLWMMWCRTPCVKRKLASRISTTLAAMPSLGQLSAQSVTRKLQHILLEHRWRYPQLQLVAHRQ